MAKNKCLLVEYFYLKQNSVASGEKLGFQITLLLASYFYFDFFQNQLPPFEKTTDTPMALIFFMVIIINQFGTIIGPFIAFIAFKRSSQFKSYHLRILQSFHNHIRLTYDLANDQTIVKMTMVPLMVVSEIGRFRFMWFCHIWLLNKAFHSFEPVKISRLKGQFPCE